MVADDPDDRKGRLKNIGGSQSDHWNNMLANQAVQALVGEELKRRGTRQAIERHRRGADGHRAQGRTRRHDGGATGRRPQRRDGMLPARHDRRTDPSRGGARTSPKPTSCPAPMRRWSKPSTAIAARASRRSRSSTSTSMRAGKRWSAWSPHPVNRGVGTPANSRNNPMQSKLPMHLSPRCHARTRSRDAVPIARDGERALPDARRQGHGRAEGQ